MQVRRIPIIAAAGLLQAGFTSNQSDRARAISTIFSITSLYE